MSHSGREQTGRWVSSCFQSWVSRSSFPFIWAAINLVQSVQGQPLNLEKEQTCIPMQENVMGSESNNINTVIKEVKLQWNGKTVTLVWTLMSLVPLCPFFIVGLARCFLVGLSGRRQTFYKCCVISQIWPQAVWYSHCLHFPSPWVGRVRSLLWHHRSWYRFVPSIKAKVPIRCL